MLESASNKSLHAIETLERFFERVDSGKMLDETDPGVLRKIRRELSDCLRYLLIWGRPQLEASKGIMWPYHELRNRYTLFRDAAESVIGNTRIRHQARLFLALLPLPSQWAWLLRLSDQHPRDPEIALFLEAEKKRIHEKLYAKPNRHSKLHHFCQLLKPYAGENEKGILRIFSLPYLFAAHPMLLKRISKRYVIFVEPPMGALFRHSWWRHYTTLDDPVLFGVGSEEDVSFLATQPHLETCSLAHGDFLEDSGRWDEPPERRDYDIVFNATFDDMERKRHKLMLHLLQHPLLQTTRALFIGRGEERHVRRFREWVAQLGLTARVTVVANIRRSEVPRYLSRCRTGVHLSLYESACRSVYEFFRSDIPCVISSSMAGMNMEIFNSQTGMAVPDSDLPKAIAAVLASRSSFSPRRWFLDHSGSHNSSRQLNSLFQTLYTKWGYEWRRDIVPLGSSGASRYVSTSDREDFMADFKWLMDCFNRTEDLQFTFSVE